MHHKSTHIHRIAFLSLCISICLILSYIESLLPYLYIPGVKIGLPNIMIVFLLYKYGYKEAYIVNLLRIVLTMFLFGNIYSFLFSLCGGILSLSFMYLLYKYEYHIYTVSIIGGISHNIGQTLIALLTTTFNYIYYLPLLLVTGAIMGLINGIISDKIIHKIK